MWLLLLFLHTAAKINVCKLASVVAAVRRYARTGDLGMRA